MPFKMRKDGSTIYDKNGKLKIPSNPNLFTREVQEYDPTTGYPLVMSGPRKGMIDWDKAAEEKKRNK